MFLLRIILYSLKIYIRFICIILLKFRSLLSYSSYYKKLETIWRDKLDNREEIMISLCQNPFIRMLFRGLIRCLESIKRFPKTPKIVCNAIHQCISYIELPFLKSILLVRKDVSMHYPIVYHRKRSDSLRSIDSYDTILSMPISAPSYPYSRMKSPARSI